MSFSPTMHQQSVIAARAAMPDHSLVVQGGPGTGKSRLLGHFAQAADSLYLATDPLVVAAQRVISPSTHCRTFQSLAFESIKRPMRRDLQPAAVADTLGLPDRRDLPAVQLAAWSIAALKNYSLGGGCFISEHDVPAAIERAFVEDVVTIAKALWQHLTDKLRNYVPYSVGLKLWQLGGAPLQRQYSCVLVDNIHHAQPVLLDAMNFVTGPVVYAGDGCLSAALGWHVDLPLEHRGDYPLEHRGPTYGLTESFSLPRSVARVATGILAHSSYPDIRLIGRGQDTPIDTGEPTFALGVVCRTQAGAVDTILNSVGNVHVGDGLEHICQFLRGIESLCEGFPASTVPLLAPFRSYAQLVDHLATSADPELYQLHALVGRYRGRFREIEASIRARAVPEGADTNYTVVTARGLRGKRLPNVKLGEDYPTVPELRRLMQNAGAGRYNREIALIYLSCISARSRAFLSRSTRELLTTKPIYAPSQGHDQRKPLQ